MTSSRRSSEEYLALAHLPGYVAGEAAAAGRRLPRQCLSAAGRDPADRRALRRHQGVPGRPLILIEVDNLDVALAVAARASGRCEPSSAIEVRPVRTGFLVAGWGRGSSAITGDGCSRRWSGCSGILSWPRTWPRRPSRSRQSAGPGTASPPTRPPGLIFTTARNRAIDQIRRQQVLAEKTRLIAHELTRAPGTLLHDGRTDDLPRRAPRADLHLLPPGASVP